MTDFRRTLGHTAVYGIGLMANRGAAYLLIPLYTRTLEPRQIALWELSTTTILFLLPLLELGMATALLRFYHYFESDTDRRQAFNTSLIFVTTVLMSGALIVTAASGPLSKAIFESTDQTPLIWMLTGVAVLTALANQPLAWLRTQERSVAFVVLSLVRAIIGPLSIVYLVVVMDYGVAGILLGDMVGLGVMALVALTLCRRWLRLEFSLDKLRPMLAFGLPLLPMGIAGPLLMVSDRFFVMRWMGEEALATFTIGAKIGIIMQFFTQAFQTAYPPAAFQIANRDDAGPMFSSIFRLVLVGLGLAALSLSAAGPELTYIFAPADAYSRAYLVVPFIALSYMIHGGVLNLTTGLAIARRTLWASVVVCGAALAKVTFNLPLISAFGIVGAASATLAAHLFELVLAYVITQRIYRVPHYPLRLLMYFIIIGLATALVLAAPSFGDAPGLIIRITVVLAFAGICWTCFVTPAERAAGIDTVRRIMQRLVPGRGGAGRG